MVMKADDIILLIAQELKKEREELDVCYKNMIKLASCATSENYYYQKGRVDAFERVIDIIGTHA